MAPYGANVKHKKPKNRKNKVILVFDEAKRKEFLTGFHKRKLQRKKKAKEQLENDLKEERKRLKQAAKENYKKLVQSSKPIPELEELLKKEEYEDDDVEVKVTELSSSELAKQNNWIGPNQPKYESDDEEEVEDDEQMDEEVPGMELKAKRPEKEPKPEKETFDTQKDIKKLLKKQATKNVKKSKVFQRKHKIDRQQQKKKSLQQKKERIKMQTKIAKKKHRVKPMKS